LHGNTRELTFKNLWQAAAYFAASSFAVTARQQMTEALRARTARCQQERGGLAHGKAQLWIEDDGEAAVQVEKFIASIFS
jgi:hypothetical protein